MPSYKELKSEQYLQESITFAGQLLDLRFTPTGSNSFTAYCPFHKDNKDSFRVYVNKEGVVRFHCFGACNADWDIFDVIQKKKNCSFREAQLLFARHIEEHVQLFDGLSSPELKKPTPAVVTDITDEEPSVSFNKPKKLSQDVIDVLEESAVFYNQLLTSENEGYQKIQQYLLKRGVDEELIREYQIGYAPPYQDEKFSGKALLRKHLDKFIEDYNTFYPFNRAGLFRLLADETSKAYSYYRQFIEVRKDIYSLYGDYFAGKITFPVKDIHGQICGIMGRRPDNRGTTWIKQQTGTTDLNPKSWLYGIDKTFPHIETYRTVILVEGIFDYFAFLSILKDPPTPIVVSTLGVNLTDESLDVLKQLQVKTFIVAYDWDAAGKNAIERIAKEVSGIVYYMGGMKAGSDPAEHLKNIAHAIDGFSLSSLLASAEKTQALTNKPVGIDFIISGKRVGRKVAFSRLLPMSKFTPPLLQEKPKEYTYDADDFLPLLSYDHGNKTLLDAKIDALVKLILRRPDQSEANQTFTLPSNFVEEEKIAGLGNALIFWLKIVIEQQRQRRKVKITGSALAQQLKTSRATVMKYKKELRDLGYLKVEDTGRVQKLSVKYFIK